MKQRTFLWMFLSFLSGMGVAYGLMFLDRKATVPRLERTDIFEVVSSDGTVLRLSYSEIERDREELRRARQRIEGLERAVLRGRGQIVPPSVPPSGEPQAESPLEKAEGSRRPEAKGPKARDENLQNLFAKSSGT